MILAMLFILTIYFLNQGLSFLQMDNASKESVNEEFFIASSSQKISFSLQYKEHNNITIDGNSEFAQKATEEGWSGDGTPSNPYLINGLNITNAPNNLIQIWNTDLHFQISHCFLSGGKIGISLFNVINAKIFGNVIENSSIAGIYLSNSFNNTISSNNITNTKYRGLWIQYSEYNVVSNNYFFSNEMSVYILRSKYISLFNNSVTNNNAEGLFGDSTSNITLSNNSFSNNGNYGSYFYYSNRITIKSNVFSNNGYIGAFKSNIYLSYCNTSRIINNSVSESAFHGILLSRSETTIIYKNLVHNNQWGGIYLASTNDSRVFGNYALNNNHDGITLVYSRNVSISYNDVFTNKDDGINTLYSFNNEISYNNVSNNTKYGVKLYSSNITSVKQNNLNTNNLGGSSQANDNGQNNLFTHNFWNGWISPDSNSDGIVDNSYQIDGSSNSKDLFPNVFPISLPSHSLSIPTIIYPTGEETLNETIIIKWTVSIDSWDFKVIYDIYVSADNGVSWTLLASSLISNSYPWDTQSVEDGSSYLIKVVAKSFEIQMAYDVSDSSFSINNKLDNDQTDISTKKSPGWTVTLFLLSIICLTVIRRIR